MNKTFPLSAGRRATLTQSHQALKEVSLMNFEQETVGSENDKADRRRSRRDYIASTVIAALVAAVAATIMAALSLPVWVMFVGFIAWYTRPVSVGAGVSSILCVWLGIILAATAELAIGISAPHLGAIALPVIVFGVAFLVVALRTTRVVDNMACWFLGFVTFFAAAKSPSVAHLATLASGVAAGGLAGWTCQILSARFEGTDGAG